MLSKGPNIDELYKKYEDQYKYYQERNELREKNLKVDRSLCKISYHTLKINIT